MIVKYELSDDSGSKTKHTFYQSLFSAQQERNRLIRIGVSPDCLIIWKITKEDITNEIQTEKN